MNRCLIKSNLSRNIFQFSAKLIFIFLVFTLIFGIPNVSASLSDSGGRIFGSIVDSETGESLPGATIFLENTTIGTASDLDGAFSLLKIPPGRYNLIIHLIGYARTKIENLEIEEGKLSKLDIALVPDAIKIHDVVVTAKAIQNTEGSLLKKRQKSVAISDAISAEAISRYGSSDAAEAMSQITGASVVDGKYVLVRGLGERYSNTKLNGAELPSADPDKKAFQMDLLPVNLLDNLIVTKSFTPDQPGNFTGGIIDIGTKTYPESFSLKYSTSCSFTKGTTGNKNFLTYPGGNKDWFGMDDGTRNLPEELQDTSIVIPDIGYAFTDSVLAHELDRLSKSFTRVMAPTVKTAPLNKNFSLSLGNTTMLSGGIPLGYLGSFSYNRKYSFYDDGKVASWKLTGNISEVDELNKDFELKDSHGKDEVIWGGLAILSLKPHPAHELTFNYLFTQSGESSSRYLTGKFYDGNLPDDAVYETRVLKYTERNLQSIQLRGQHNLNKFKDINIEWMISNDNNSQDEPDLRFFSNHYFITENDTTNSVDTTYSITPSHYRVPQRYFRYLDENNLRFDLKISMSFKQWADLSGKLTFGGLLNQKNRTYRERVFEYRNQDYSSYEGDPNEYLSDSNLGIIDSTTGYSTFYIFGNYIVESSEARSNYDGDQEITASFVMVELPIARRLRLIGGARYEKTIMNIVTKDSTYEKGELRNHDLLPSVSLIYQLKDNMNLRLAYGKTLARPTFRELAPFPSWDFANGFFFIGNPELNRTLIDNYDVRWEWFVRPCEIIALSTFYKKFHNPIERTIKNENGEIQFQNVDRAEVYGIEFEVRKKLDQVSSSLKNFQLGSNFSWANSKVKIPEAELISIRGYDPNAGIYRPLWGQSKYIFNLFLGYDNNNYGTKADLNFSVFSERLSEVSIGGTPNIYELPQPSLNFIISQKLISRLNFKLSARNLLNTSARKVYHFKKHDYIYQEHKKGRSISAGISYVIG
ncbi:MAG: hypothetical protein B6D58_05360 [candidate division Zixibacteria bacterium 4484_95]|nr:MAG: hypothetical protein B6D58_05360 [candidate division Zixibacteria bacterium 4484_95]RKX20446.1 MAG: TonB-dependent receptor [candidate division Zixibacteria bacterium]